MTEAPTLGAVPTGTAPSGVQRCSKCGTDKPLEAFAVRSNRKNGRASQCKECVNQWAAGYRQTARPRARTETRQCETCGSDFEWSSTHAKQVFCSKVCYRPKGTRIEQLRRRAPEGSWVCSACFETKPLEDFPGDRRASRCNPCQASYQGEWRRKNVERVREQSRRSRRKAYPMKAYGITREEYDAGLARAKTEGCPICLRTEADGVTFHQDHCHGSGRIRGWLCSDCNKALGMFADDQERLARAIEYLLRSD